MGRGHRKDQPHVPWAVQELVWFLKLPAHELGDLYKLGPSDLKRVSRICPRRFNDPKPQSVKDFSTESHTVGQTRMPCD